MSEYRVTLTSEYGIIVQSYRDLMRAKRQAEMWRQKFPVAKLKIDRITNGEDT